MSCSPRDCAERIWHDARLPAASLSRLTLTGADPVFPSSFRVGCAAQSSLAVAALAASVIAEYRTGQQIPITVDMLAAALETSGYFQINGKTPTAWAKYSGLYHCGVTDTSDWVRIHANFDHHRDGALKILGLLAGDKVERNDVEQALQSWHSKNFEAAAAKQGLPIVAIRSFAEWDQHPQCLALIDQPLVSIERIGNADPIIWPQISQEPALTGIRAIDCTRILAGPVCGRTLAAYGTDVMLINSPNLPNISAIADTSRGKLSAHLELKSQAGISIMHKLIKESHIFIQGYRPTAFESLGLGYKQVAALRPGIVYASLNAYGYQGPWAKRPGFDSLVQSATGFNLAEAEAADSDKPKPLPMQILDYASGFLLAFGIQTALLRQQHEGGSWHVKVSLARTGQWLRSLGRVAGGLNQPAPELQHYTQLYPSAYGQLSAMPHAALFADQPASWNHPSVPPGTHPPQWSSA